MDDQVDRAADGTSGGLRAQCLRAAAANAACLCTAVPWTAPAFRFRETVRQTAMDRAVALFRERAGCDVAVCLSAADTVDAVVLVPEYPAARVLMNLRWADTVPSRSRWWSGAIGPTGTPCRSLVSVRFSLWPRRRQFTPVWPDLWVLWWRDADRWFVCPQEFVGYRTSLSIMMVDGWIGGAAEWEDAWQGARTAARQQVAGRVGGATWTIRLCPCRFGTPIASVRPTVRKRKRNRAG